MYEWKCKRCGTVSISLTYGVAPGCTICDVTDDQHRVYTFHTKAMFVPHFNPSVGRYVTSQADFTEALKEAGAREEQRTGIATSYVAREQGDADAFGVSEEAREDYARLHFNDPVTESLI